MTSLMMVALPLYAQDDEIHGIRGLAGDTYWEANWQWLAPTLVGGVVVFALLAWLAYKHLNKPRQFTPREIALQQLAHAQQSIADESPDADKRFSVMVSDALRGYLEHALGLRAPEQTTEEFLQEAHRNPQLSEEAFQALGEFLRLCDLAKFARHAFGLDERQQLLATAKDFIVKNEKTKQPTSATPPTINKVVTPTLAAKLPPSKL